MIKLQGLTISFYTSGLRRVGKADACIEIENEKAVIDLAGVVIPSGATGMQITGNIEVSGHGLVALYTPVISLEGKA